MRKKRMQKMPPWHRYDHLTVLYFKQLPKTFFKRCFVDVALAYKQVNIKMDSISDLLEDIVKECGGLGKFQAILLVIMFGTKVTVTWSMLMMTFGGATPDWWCNMHNVTSSSGQNKMSNFSTMQLLKQCEPPANISGSCDSHSYSSDMNTLVSEVSTSIIYM